MMTMIHVCQEREKQILDINSINQFRQLVLCQAHKTDDTKPKEGED
jgi:hypothetical protein